MKVLLYILGASALGITTAAIVRNLKFRRHRGLAREVFAGQFVGRGVPELIAETVYDFYKAESGLGSFSPAPQDRIADLYGRHDEAGIEDDILDLFRILKMSYPPSSNAAEWPRQLTTLDDMIM